MFSGGESGLQGLTVTTIVKEMGQSTQRHLEGGGGGTTVISDLQSRLDSNRLH